MKEARAGDGLYTLIYGRGKLGYYFQDDEKEKIKLFLQQSMPQISNDRWLLIPNGNDMDDSIPQGIQLKDVLIDSASSRLKDWQYKGGIGIQILNGKNNDEEWDGARIDCRLDSLLFAYQLQYFIVSAIQDEYSENFLYEFFKWARKFGGIPTGITQNIEDLLNSPKARTMIGNSEFLLLLNQSPSDREELANLLNLSREQLSCISNAKRGSGLMKFGNTIIPFVNEFPKDTLLYDLWSTDFGEKTTQ